MTSFTAKCVSCGLFFQGVNISLEGDTQDWHLPPDLPEGDYCERCTEAIISREPTVLYKLPV